MPRLWLCIVLGVGAAAACNQHRPTPAPTPSALTSVAAADRALALSSVPSDRLPEDPDAGARALAQWHEHLVEEERERKAVFDRRRIKEHRQVLASLREARGRYDRATTEAQLRALQADFPRASAATRALIQKLDPWHNSSAVVDDYQALLDTLTDGYPASRLRALSGSKEEQDRLRGEIDARLQKITDWLASAEEAEQH